MGSNTPSPKDAGDLLTKAAPSIDRRTSPRMDCHTVVTTVMLQDASAEEPLRIFKAHSQNISAGGAKLILSEPLPAKRVYLRFLLPTHWHRFVEADIVGESVCDTTSLITRLTRQYVYSVRFTGRERSAASTVLSSSPSHRPMDQ